MRLKKHAKKRRSLETAKKMRSHIQELSCFFNQRIGAMENMLDGFIEEENARRRRTD